MPGLNRSITTATTCCEIASSVNQTLKQSLPLAACRDDVLSLPVIDALIFERSRNVIRDSADVCLKVKRGGDEMHRFRLERVLGRVVLNMLSDQSETRVERMQRVERVRAAFGFFLHPLDQQLEHLHRQSAVANAA